MNDLDFYMEGLRTYEFKPDIGLFIHRTTRRIAGCYTPDGHLMMSVTFNGKRRQIKGTKLAWFCFNKYIPETEVRFKNYDKYDLSINNLYLKERA